MRAQFMPLDGGPPVEIAKEMTLIGRQEDCDLRLDHKSVSKMHCVVVKTDLVAEKYSRHYERRSKDQWAKETWAT